MGKLFGTDGIRGIAFKEPITKETAAKLGQSALTLCVKQGKNKRVVLGRDTRESGRILEQAVAHGVLSSGGEVFTAGKLPTPAVALLTRENNAGAGIVISASHNPHEYNGFKIFSSEGYKLSEEEEKEIEDMMASLPDPDFSVSMAECKILSDATSLYESFLKKTAGNKLSLEGMKIVLDCSNGATWQCAPRTFKDLGAVVEALAVNPNGRNINLRCGSEHTDFLKKKVVETGSDMGLAFDGDGDRLVAVDENGRSITGDQVLAICARMLKNKGKLRNNLVISTVMSNIGLGFSLKDIGVKLISTKVGDRCVMEEMRTKKAVLGGEDSGHIIFAEHHTTGDGLISALQLITAVIESGEKLSALSGCMKVFPQTLINVPIKDKPEIHSIDRVSSVLNDIERKLGDRGRILVRYSGTEPLCRVMVEGETKEETSRFAAEIASAIEKEIGRR
jgi:phosphoglucosamine mutase